MFVAFAFGAALMAMQSMTSANDPRWQRIGGDANGEYSVDPSSIERRGDRIRAAIRLRFATARESGLRQGVMQYDINCSAGTLRTERFDTYTDAGFHGTEVTPSSLIEDVPIQANSPNSEVQAYLCRR